MFFVNMVSFEKFPQKTVLMRCHMRISPTISLSVNDTHMEELDSVQKFIETQGWLLLKFFMCLHNQLSSFNSVFVQTSEKRDSSSKQ